jgi:hypothetical protein
MSQLLKTVILLFLVYFCVSCASRYRLIQPFTVDFIDSIDSIQDQQVTIAYRYHVLKDSGNKKYVRKEYDNQVSLLAVRINNDGPDTLFFPENFLVKTKLDTLSMLHMEEAYELLCQTIVEDNDYEVEGLIELLISLPIEINNMIVQPKANKNFNTELEEYYLLPCYIAPGVSMIGLLALDVEKDTPLWFGLK